MICGDDRGEHVTLRRYPGVGVMPSRNGGPLFFYGRMSVFFSALQKEIDYSDILVLICNIEQSQTMLPLYSLWGWHTVKTYKQSFTLY
jgi:hypothetical protein